MIPHEQKNVINSDSDYIFKRNCLVIIDDDSTSASVLQLFASNFFNEIHFFTTIEEALPFLVKHKVDMIISDYYIPGFKNGSQLAPIVKNSDPNIQFIIASGHIENITEDINLKFVDNFIEKPYNYTEFLKTIK